MPPVFPLTMLLLSQIPDPGWSDDASPCVDSLLAHEGTESIGGFDWGQGTFWGSGAVEDCDAEESLLFLNDRAREVARKRESARASFTMSRTPGTGMASVTRHVATRGGWDDRLELRRDEPARWRLGYTESGWRAVAGEMTDTVMSAWPRALPRRTLPAGWQAARGPEERPLSFSAPAPQGVAFGALHPRWKAYAMRAWNPVETGREPPWSEAWELKHSVLGVSASLPWNVALQLSETRIARAESDTLSERLLAASVASPASRGGGFEATAARLESDGARAAGWFLAGAARRDFEDGSEAALSLRQRTRDWTSAWDPAIAEEDAYPAPEEGGAEKDERDARFGAGEARVSGRVPFTSASSPSGSAAEGYARGEIWTVWNPRAGGAGSQSGTYRRGVRLALGRRAGDIRLEASGTGRVARATSGSLSRYVLAKVEARIEGFPHWRASAWRAWNGDRPLRTGLFVGAEPRWSAFRLAPGYRLEEASGRFEGRATLEARLRLGALDLGLSAALPLQPSDRTLDAGAASWRLMLSTGR